MKDYNFPVVANRSFNPNWFGGQTILPTNESGLATAKVSTEPTIYRVLLLVVHKVQICGQTQVLVTGTMVQIIAQPKLLCSYGEELAKSVT